MPSASIMSNLTPNATRLSFCSVPSIPSSTWSNVETMLQLGNFYAIGTIMDASNEFLENNQHCPLTAIYIAGKHGSHRLYKKSSIYVIDNFYEYKKPPRFRNVEQAYKEKAF